MTAKDEVVDLLPDRCPFSLDMDGWDGRVRCTGVAGHSSTEHYWTQSEAEEWLRMTKERFLEAMRGRPGWGA